MEIKKTFDFYDQTYLRSYNLNDSIKYQLALLDSLDVFTRKHCENVAIITSNLCKKLHCTKGFTEYCIICAYLHDIGKMYIPQSILQKPSILTDEEYEIMKKHTTLGYKLCIKDPKLRPYHAGPYYHHEALDGSGYPQGLSKGQIPYEAQIIRVADEYDALVSKRQYKTHIGISDSFKIIVENTLPSGRSEKYPNLGKNNKIIVEQLRKVIIDDIEYEISANSDYLNHLKKEIARCKKIEEYIKKRDSSKNEKKYVYYDQYAKLYLNKNESLENFSNMYSEILSLYEERQKNIADLYNEIKIIKKLKI